MVNKKKLTTDIANAVKTAVQDQKVGSEILSNDVTNAVCNVLEALFIHGLKDPYVVRNIRDKYPEPNFWLFVQKFTHRNVRAQIGNLNQIKSDVGRCRVWLRIALNDGLLENYVNSIAREPQIVRHYYLRQAFLRDSEQVEVLCNYVRALSKLSFKAPINSGALNSWTPTPLKLAGLIENDGKTRISADDDESTDEAVDALSALEFDGLDDSRLDSQSDSTSVVFTAHSPESVAPRPFFGDRSAIFSDGDESVLSSMPDASSPCYQEESELRFRSILNSVISNHVLPLDHLSSVNQTASHEEKAFTTPLSEAVTAAKDEDKLELNLNAYDEPEDQRNVVIEDSNSPIPLDTNMLMPTSLSDTVTKSIEVDKGFDNSADFQYSFSPSGNSLKIRGGWSSSYLNDVEPSEPRQESPAQEPELASSFTSTLRKVLDDTFLKKETSGDNTDFKAVESNNADMPSGTSGSEDVAVYQSSTIIVENDTGVDNGEAANDGYVVVHYVPANVEPAEKAFRMSYLTKIANEVGLNAQDYKCNGCKRSIGLMFGAYRVCHYDGRYYCSECHFNEEAIIPARILHNWDLKHRRVCRASKAFLDHVADQPLIYLSQSSASLVDFIEKVKEVKLLRLQLSYVAMYLLACRDIVAEDLRKRIWPKEYLYQEVDLYSVMDLTNTSTGHLQKHLKSVIQFAIKHVLETCQLCASKGFVCEICSDSKIIYPFQTDITQRCTKCYSVYHRTCADGRPCPKCARREMYSKSSLDSGIEMPPFAEF